MNYIIVLFLYIVIILRFDGGDLIWYIESEGNALSGLSPRRNDKAVRCVSNLGRLYFLTLLIFQVREHCYNCADYSCNTRNNCNNPVESHRLPP